MYHWTKFVVTPHASMGQSKLRGKVKKNTYNEQSFIAPSTRGVWNRVYQLKSMSAQIEPIYISQGGHFISVNTTPHFIKAAIALMDWHQSQPSHRSRRKLPTAVWSNKFSSGSTWTSHFDLCTTWFWFNFYNVSKRKCFPVHAYKGK